MISSERAIGGGAPVADLTEEDVLTFLLEEIVELLRPGADESLKVKPDGRIFQGNTRIKVLEERGYPVNDLPRDPSHEHE